MNRSEFKFFHPHRVRYSGIDMQGVVFNSHYLNYFDAAITEFMRYCGYDYVKEAQKDGIDFHLVKATVECLTPVYYDEEIEIGVRVGRFGRNGLNLELGLFGKTMNEISSKSEIIWVYTDMETHQSTAISNFRKEQLSHPPLDNEALVGENPEKA